MKRILIGLVAAAMLASAGAAAAQPFDGDRNTYNGDRNHYDQNRDNGRHLGWQRRHRYGFVAPFARRQVCAWRYHRQVCWWQ